MSSPSGVGLGLEAKGSNLDNSSPLVSIWNGMRITAKSTYGAAGTSSLHIVFAVALRAVSTSLSIVALGLFSGFFLTKIVVNIVDKYNEAYSEKKLQELKLKLLDLNDKHRFKIVAILVSSFVVGLLVPILGFIIAFAFGVTHGIIDQSLKNRGLQNQSSSK